ncbi:TPA: type I toxin-antitoxin system Fst family toxin [Staphylococcus aureus]|nr:type I toxin-antitoxin system Fst family toxin [Staphylococcus aureus]HCY9162896.1 type I toxin-antitoxin system Fst family toxin [Staphylococcus aureus]
MNEILVHIMTTAISGCLVTLKVALFPIQFKLF